MALIGIARAADGRDRPNRGRRAFRLVTTGAALCWSYAAAYAQTPSPLAEWQYAAGVPLQKLFNPSQAPKWQVRVGGAVSWQPRYDGAKNYRVLAGPSVDIRYRDWFFLSTGEGLGINVVNNSHWRASVGLAYDLGRRSADDASYLSGLPNINPAPAVKIAAEYVWSKELPLVLRADVRHNIGGAGGWIGDLSAYLPLPGSSKKFFWFAGPTVTFADSRYMNSWFGINQEQAGRSGYPRYDASAGLKSAGAGVTAVWFFQKHWFMTADTAVKRLLGSASRSPVIQQKTNTVVDLSVNYQF